ncbi:MAG: tRNA preQ1(34) S-adenosylmethionine ribosyltransferase-isomerase QueA [Planctomycetota bacterium]|nr:tRNA preQ1(34) S-adenosylmethionine ribosyltransferase-isomerase QueA [Planctomycetota bacterium]
MTRTTRTDGIPPANDEQGAQTISDYEFSLPDHLIAQEPAPERSSSRCYFCSRGQSGGTASHFQDLPQHLTGNEVLVVNDTRVIPARIRCQRRSGGSIEVFLIKPLEDQQWLAWVSPSRRIKPGEFLDTQGPPLKVIGRKGTGWVVELGDDGFLEQVGEVPLPPYIHRDREDPRLTSVDQERYQTVFASKPGAVAAPTAGLHFDQKMLDELKMRSIPVLPITLHVGPGTFKPIETENIADHRVDPEWYTVSSETRTALSQARAAGKSIIAVGTTSLRVLESLGTLEEGSTLDSETDLTILPGHEFTNTDGLITNFHLPRSSLLVLVSAFHGRENTLSLYQQAIKSSFRFYSYGDCMAILPPGIK